LKKVAILQSNYIPWKGYFDMINMADLFIFHDDLQYTKNDWRNRNKIKTRSGTEWLTIPCGTNEKRLICEVLLPDNKWQKDHWNKIKNSYSKSSYFSDYKNFFEEIYLNIQWQNLCELNQYVIKRISKELLGVETTFDDSRNYGLTEKKEHRVKELLLKCNAELYLSGPAAKNYLSEDFLIQSNIKIEWMNYSNYKEYNQLYPPFEHAVTILDLIFNEGPNVKNYLKSF
jgi:hypothetical protein